MKQVFYAQRSSIVPSSIMVNTTNCTFKKISEINIPSLGAVQHVCMGGISHTSKILPTLLWASSLEQHDHHKNCRKFEMFQVYNVHACCVCSQSRSLLSFSFFFFERFQILFPSSLFSSIHRCVFLFFPECLFSYTVFNRMLLLLRLLRCVEVREEVPKNKMNFRLSFADALSCESSALHSVQIM